MASLETPLRAGIETPAFNAEDSLSARLQREAALLIGGTGTGIKQSLAEAWDKPGMTAAKVGGAALVGAGLVLLQSRAGAFRVGAQVVGGALGVSFLTDVAGRAGVTAQAIGDTWRSSENLERNKQIVASSLGSFVFDAALMSSGGLAGSKVARAGIPAFQERQLLKALESYHADSAHHSRRVARYSRLIAEEMGLPRWQRGLIEHAGKMHDIGKLDVPLAVLGKRSPLTAAEWEVMKSHAYQSFVRLQGVRYSGRRARLPEVAAAHHEKLDGSGYYRGVNGDQIALETRVVTVADVFDAMTSLRGYKPRLPLAPIEEVLTQLTCWKPMGRVRVCRKPGF
ncbi:MAG TPA: HD domain-containing phosphohydrolase [Candidatus Obscuribacterales bacterium]